MGGVLYIYPAHLAIRDSRGVRAVQHTSCYPCRGLVVHHVHISIGKRLLRAYPSYSVFYAWFESQ